MDSRFYSCNRGIVINLEHAVDFDGSMFLMDDDNNIPVSRKPVSYTHLDVYKRQVYESSGGIRM